MTHFMQKLVNRLVALVMVVLLGLGGVLGYNMTRSQLAADIYRQRLSELSGDYESLRQTYNQAVRRTAVTELIVEDGRIDVRIRTADGEVETIPTDFNPDFEIYVDYVVIDGRLWIRRVFDQYTAPGEALVIDPALGEIDWDDEEVEEGKAVYRRLEEGRWIVTVTGDGALGLARREGEPESTLAPPPELRQHEEIEQRTRRGAEDVGPTDVLRHLFGE